MKIAFSLSKSVSLKRCVFSLLLLWLSPLAFAQNEELRRIEYRTLGWGVQQTFTLSGATDSVPVFRSQFSDEMVYVGSDIMEFQIGQSDSADNEFKFRSSPPTDSEAVAPVRAAVARAQIPKGMNKVLLIFLRSNAGSDLPFKVAVLDDSTSDIYSKNVHFYNISPEPLVVRAFDEARNIPGGGQSVWKLKSSDSKSALQIAVTNPEAKLVYSSRFRLLDSQRLVFMARKRGDSDDASGVVVASFLERVRETAAPSTEILYE